MVATDVSMGQTAVTSVFQLGRLQGQYLGPNSCHSMEVHGGSTWGHNSLE